jgi:hypothetical protein
MLPTSWEADTRFPRLTLNLEGAQGIFQTDKARYSRVSSAKKYCSIFLEDRIRTHIRECRVVMCKRCHYALTAILDPIPFQPLPALCTFKLLG